jgi:hypothetical protein
MGFAAVNPSYAARKSRREHYSHVIFTRGNINLTKP